MSELVLKIKGREYRGWEEVSVTKSLSQICGPFHVLGTDIFPGKPEDWNISMGDECEIAIDSQIINTGYVEEIPINYTPTNHYIQIAGRDITCDLVDCSFAETPNEWTGLSVFKLIETFCTPFDIPVFADDSVESDANTVIDKFKADEAATPYELILKIAKIKAILPINYGDAKLTLTRAGTTRAFDVIELGKNAKAGGLIQSNRDRFSKYIVKGSGVGGDLKSLFSTVQPIGEALDEVVSRYRPTVMFLEDAADKGKCTSRARWEARNRAGKSRSITYEVSGWTQSNGAVWPLNALVGVKDSFLNINATLLISELIFTFDSDGEKTTITLADPTAYELLAEPIKTIATGFDWRKLKEVIN